MIITIDGPAGSGKSTAARKLAARLEVAYLDTGAMYRAVALKVLESEADVNDADALVELARTAELSLDCGPTHTRVRLDGHDVSEAIRAFAVGTVTPYVATNQAIRDILVEKQRVIGRQLGSLVTEGRDQGSVVFPDADVKFVLDATLDKRAERRHQELVADGEEVSIEQVRDNLALRDRNDARQWAALLEPGQSIRIDTTRMTIGQMVDRLVAHIEQITEQKL
ncbi:MAG TPA: (d)CMP kinase [Phycisphaerae bacterium]|nr:(d)CMP kinase [Phycisphaerae bacterium]